MVQVGRRLSEAPEEEFAGMDQEDKQRGEIYAYLYLSTKSAIAEHLRGIINSELAPMTGLWKKGLAILERRDAHNWARIRSRHIGVGEELGDQFTPDNSFL